MKMNMLIDCLCMSMYCYCIVCAGIPPSLPVTLPNCRKLGVRRSVNVVFMVSVGLERHVAACVVCRNHRNVSCLYTEKTTANKITRLQCMTLNAACIGHVRLSECCVNCYNVMGSI